MNKPEVPKSAISELITLWVNWLFTRRFYAAPLPQNILARMQEENSKKVRLPPDARNDALCCAWNLVMQDAKESEAETFICFIFVYLPDYRPYKVSALAIELNIDTDTVYQRAHNSAIKYYNKALKLAELNAMMQREVEDFLD